MAIRGGVVIEPNGIGIEVAKQQGRAEFVFLVIQHRQNVRMVERLDDLELTSRRSLPSLTFFLLEEPVAIDRMPVSGNLASVFPVKKGVRRDPEILRCFRDSQEVP